MRWHFGEVAEYGTKLRIEQAEELLLGPVRRTVRQLAFEEPATTVKIVPSRLGDSAVALGSAALVLREIFAQI